MQATGGAAALALENERLDAELLARVKELRASRARIVESADAARRRIERDLHDGAQQRLVALSLPLRMASAGGSTRRAGGGQGVARRRVAATWRSAIRELRELARAIHPAVLTDRGLGSALRALAQRMPMPVEIAAAPEGAPAGEPVEAAAYFVVAEAITNVARYAEASHAVGRRALRRTVRLIVTVADDGIGGADPGNGSGLRGLGDRIAALDGRLEVSSTGRGKERPSALSSRPRRTAGPAGR